MKLPDKSIFLLSLHGLFNFMLVLLLVPHQTSKGAPKSKEAASIAPAEIQGAFGKDLLSKEIEAIRKKLPEDPVADYGFRSQFENRIKLLWKESGLTLTFDHELQLHAAHFDAGNVPEHSKYAGELPYKLAFSDSPDEVDKKLNNPVEKLVSKTNQAGVSDWSFPKLGLIIVFGPNKENEPEIRSVVLFHPEKM